MYQLTVFAKEIGFPLKKEAKEGESNVR